MKYQSKKHHEYRAYFCKFIYLGIFNVWLGSAGMCTWLEGFPPPATVWILPSYSPPLPISSSWGLKFLSYINTSDIPTFPPLHVKFLYIISSVCGPFLTPFSWNQIWRLLFFWDSSDSYFCHKVPRDFNISEIRNLTQMVASQYYSEVSQTEL